MGRRNVWRATGAIGAFAAAVGLGVAPVYGQAETQVASAPPLRIFLDCERWMCDFDHIRREAPYVDYVRNREDADLHVLVTQEGTAAGGSDHVFHVIGLGDLESRSDTLHYVSRPDDTEDETRAGITRTFGVALARHVAERAAGGRLEVVFTPQDDSEGTTQTTLPQEDPWNLWVFRARVSGEIEGESRQDSRAFDGSFSANRTTEDFKIDLRSRFDYERDEFELSSGETLQSIREDFDVSGTLVWSLGDHWSAGLQGATTGATRLNQDLAIRAGPAIEYNFFPYAESTRRQITFLYKASYAYFDYEELTLFGENRESRPEHTLDISVEFQEPWGQINSSIEGSAFLDDWSKHRIDFFSRLEVRLFRGVSLDISGSVARVKNQIYIPREDIPDSDILLARRQLGTDFEYSMDIGLNFTFGSVFNNVVNPRMNTGGGGRGRFF